MIARAQDETYEEVADKIVNPAQQFEPDVNVDDVERVESHKA
jgi:hypothetical protein